MNNIDQAFRVIERQAFLPDEIKKDARVNGALPIGYGQTNSQPSLVREMLQWLDPQPGDKVLDVGSGSGWTSALLAYIVGKKGQVFAVERIPELVKFGRENCKRFDLKNVTFYQAGEIYGLPDHAPFKRILVSASARSLPLELIDQLEPGGKLIIPVGFDILEITKLQNGALRTITRSGFIFVPLI